MAPTRPLIKAAVVGFAVAESSDGCASGRVVAAATDLTTVDSVSMLFRLLSVATDLSPTILGDCGFVVRGFSVVSEATDFAAVEAGTVVGLSADLEVDLIADLTVDLEELDEGALSSWMVLVAIRNEAVLKAAAGAAV